MITIVDCHRIDRRRSYCVNVVYKQFCKLVNNNVWFRVECVQIRNKFIDSVLKVVDESLVVGRFCWQLDADLYRKETCLQVIYLGRLVGVGPGGVSLAGCRRRCCNVNRFGRRRCGKSC